MTWTRRSRYTYDSRKKEQRRKQKGGSMGTWTRRSRYTYDSRKKERRRRKQKGGSIGTILSSAAKVGYSLGKDKKYRRMSFSGFSDSGGRPRNFSYY